LAARDIGGSSAQQFIIYNGPTYSPVMTGQMAREETMGDKITISDVQSSIVNLKSKFEQVSQLIGTAPIDAAKKDELKRLVQQLHGSLETVPPEKRQDAEASFWSKSLRRTNR
jgi:hypothetical protein